MRIAYILADPGIGIFGTKGASVHAQEMIRAFRTLGHEVTVFTTKRGNTYDDASSAHVPNDLKDLPVFVVPVDGVKGAAAREQATARASARMAALAAETPYDLVYERYSLFSTAGARLAARAQSDLSDGHAFSTDRAQTAAVTRSVPLIVEVNAPLLAEQSAHRSLHDADTAIQATLRTFAAATVISCVSPPVADWVRRSLAPEPSQGAPHLVLTPNGVNTERFAPEPTTTPSHRPFTVGFLGTLKPWHGTDTLLRALASAPAEDRAEWRCEILGEGPQLAELKTLSAELGIAEQVHFRGAFPPEEVPGELARWDAGVAPYPSHEKGGEHYFSPLKIYEYLASGLPVVASEVGEIPEVIRHGEHGLLVPGSDPAALGAALATLAGDSQLRQRMGIAARAAAETQHSWMAKAEHVLEAAGLDSPASVPAQQVMH